MDEAKNVAARALLCALSVMPSTFTDTDFFTDHESFFSKWESDKGYSLPYATIIFTPSGFYTALDALITYGFVKKNVIDGSYTMASMVQRSAYWLLSQKVEGGCLQSVGRLFAAIFINGVRDRNRRLKLRRFLAMSESLSRYKIPNLTTHSIMQAAARLVKCFDEEHQRFLRNIEVISLNSATRLIEYNKAIDLCAKAGEMEEVEKWLTKLENDNLTKPDIVSYATYMDSIAKEMSNIETQKRLLEMGKEVLCRIQVANLAPDEMTMTSLINAHAQAGDREGAVIYFNMMRNELHLAPDVRTFSVVLKATVSSPRFCNMREINLILTDMSSMRIPHNQYTYGQLLLACKRNRWIDRARVWFDDLLSANIAPTKMLCDVLRDTIGEAAYNLFYSSRHESFERARLLGARGSIRTNRNNHDHGGGGRHTNNDRFQGNERGGRGRGRGGIVSSTSDRMYAPPENLVVVRREPVQMPSTTTTGTRCIHFANGNCRYGNNCRFSHIK